MSSSYSNVILSGLRQLGFGDAEIRRATRLSDVSLRAVASGDREFDDTELKRIEHASEKTIGQLGALAIEPAGGEFSELMQSWAEFSQIAGRAESEPEKQPANPLRKRRVLKNT